MIEGSTSIAHGGRISRELLEIQQSGGTTEQPGATLSEPNAPLFKNASTRRSGGWWSSILRTTIALTATAMLFGAASGTVNAQSVTTQPSVQAAQLGTQSFAVGSPLAPIASKSVKMRSPSAAEMASSIAGFRSTVEGGHTPYMSAFFEPNVGATVTRHHNAWNDSNPHNTQYTIAKLPKDGMIHVTMPVWVSGHTPDMYDAALYPKYAGGPRPDDTVERKKANAKLYAHPQSPKHNVHWIWVRKVGSNTPDQVLMPGLKADGESVRTVQLALAAKPGETLEVRWSPFVGPDPRYPIVGPDDFVGGRTFQIIIPKNVEIER